MMSTKRKLITKADIVGVLHLKQTEAAKYLGVSLSTLKSRYYRLFSAKWPNHQQREAISNQSPDERVYKHIVDTMRINHVLNPTMEPEKMITEETWKELERKSIR